MSYTVDALLALGARLYDSNDGTNWTEMVRMMSIGKASNPSINMIAVNAVNPTGRAEEYLPGLIKYNEFEWKQYWSASRQAHHLANLSATGAIVTYYKLVMPDTPGPNGNSSSYVITTFLMECGTSEMETEKPLVIEGKAKVTAPVTFTAAN